MLKSLLSESIDRRQFGSKILPGCAVACLGSTGLFSENEKKNDNQQEKHQFMKDTGFNFKEMFQISIHTFYMPLMEYFTGRFGEEKFLEMLKDGYTEIYSGLMKKVSKDVTLKNMQSFRECFNKAAMALTNRLNPEIAERGMNALYIYHAVESTETVRELKVTDCLLADIYRELNAEKIGYITHCHPDIVLAESFHPKMKLYRTKTLMMGDDCCDHKYVFEA